GCSAAATRPAPLVLPTPVANAGPTIPFHDPNIFAKSETHIRPVEDTAALLSCLDGGETVYGITLQNSNVRVSPAVDACRVGRIPRGSLVQVVGAIKSDEITTTRTVSSATSARMTFTLGFVEDIQPIFRQT
ncbi:MAG TPA: hypothetical protein PKE45_19015, partial [Caldilineaceae bacterium]|nr:hypothetical protein [Caldilineaceae bacterium]